MHKMHAMLTLYLRSQTLLLHVAPATAAQHQQSEEEQLLSNTFILVECADAGRVYKQVVLDKVRK
jgi:hypothetical protein